MNMYKVYVEGTVLWIITDDGPKHFDATQKGMEQLATFLHINFVTELPKVDIDLKNFRVLEPEEIAQIIKERADNMEFKN